MKQFKKVFTLLMLVFWAGTMMAQGYGILVNDNTYFAAEYKGKDASTGTYDEYLAHVQLASGDHFVLCNATSGDTWTVPLDQYSVAGFSRNETAGYYTTTNTGCYDFYIKLKFGEDQVYIGNGSNCGSGEPYTPVEPCAEAYGLLVDGEYVPGTKNTAQTEWTEYMIQNLALTAGQYVQIYDTCSKAAWIITSFDPAGYAFTIENEKYKVTESGTYHFYIKFIYGADEIYIGKDGWNPPSNGVPGQCGDVLMQGFYWDSYKSNDSTARTNLYGDNRWKTMLPQAGEIGAYFDLIWLPPSALAGGTGYYPRQYSNQNSDWGSRADLEKLIASFHNSGTRVVADVVLDHLIAMNGWCEFATMDFGEYGTFTPDMSWITSNDEINTETDPAKVAEQGECHGLATGPLDEGDNNDGARDLAHASQKVQEFSKAYLQWLINDMKYDGFRWDEAKGFDPAHIGEYNAVAHPYISFVERWSGTDDITWTIERTGRRTMALDFQTKYSAFDGIAGFDYSRCSGSGLLGAGYAKYAVTFIDSHDWFLRNDQEFAGLNNSMTPEVKDRLLQANAFLLGMPGVPCVFYPHWAKYKDAIKDMINARHLAGVHSESAVTDESADHDGYQCTVAGKNGWLILQLGNRTTHTAWDANYKLIAKGNGYAMWVHALNDVAPGLIVTPSAAFEDSVAGIDVTIQAVGGSGAATIYYTTDGMNPTTASAVYTSALNFKQTTTLKVMAVCGAAQSRVQEYTYTYREPLQHGIRVRFRKPAEWGKVYIFAWKPYKDEAGKDASVNLMGAYPGQRIYQEADGWFSYEFDAELDTVNFCINSGNDCGAINVRSMDLEADYDVCYGWQAGKETEEGMEELLDCETELNPEFDVAIVPESSFFRDMNEGQEVVIRAIGDENAMIYYTTDGKEPTTGSQSAQGEVKFTVRKTTTVKAYAQKVGAGRTATQSATYTYKEPQQGAITVRYIKPEDWEDLYLYAFTRVKSGGQYVDTPYSLDGKSAKWPGMKWTAQEGKWYTHTMKPEIKEIYIIFNAGLNKAQTQDIYVVENTCYLWNEDCYRAVIDSDCDGQKDEPAEGIEQVLDNSMNDHEAYKLIVNGHLVIVHNGVMYDVIGRKL